MMFRREKQAGENTELQSSGGIEGVALKLASGAMLVAMFLILTDEWMPNYKTLCAAVFLALALVFATGGVLHKNGLR